MGVRIITDVNSDIAALYCSTTMTAFGPIIQADDEIDIYSAYDAAIDFLEYLHPTDPRELTEAELEREHLAWYEWRVAATELARSKESHGD